MASSLFLLLVLVNPSKGIGKVKFWYEKGYEQRGKGLRERFQLRRDFENQQDHLVLVLHCSAEREWFWSGSVERVPLADLRLSSRYLLYEWKGRCKVYPRYGIIEINRKNHFSKYEPFVLAQKSEQVYFAEYASKKRDKADWLVVCKIKSWSAINAPELAYQEDEVSIQNEIEDNDEDPQEEVGDKEEVGEEIEIEIEDDDVNDQEDIVEMDEFNDQDDIEGGFEIDDSSTEDENEDSEDQIDYGSDGDNKSEENSYDLSNI
ncbi:pheromone-processing carboxypeptidase KEX1-like [Senna tora]|uniref:Pheromone-processing carboxypeptidase KEX1-like n=1 Tax=Senna tora TaxID=362788 RepID=A0A834XFM0_9FABA|nr:pheromone-processing carboxypeptidase KEX1-like [Senna tora]